MVQALFGHTEPLVVAFGQGIKFPAIFFFVCYRYVKLMNSLWRIGCGYYLSTLILGSAVLREF